MLPIKPHGPCDMGSYTKNTHSIPVLTVGLKT